MEFDIKIQKTEVKIYDIKVSVDYDSLVEFCKNSHIGSYAEYLDDCCRIDEFGELNDTVPIDESKSEYKDEKEFYMQYASDYIDEQDADVLFLDNCHNFKEYQLESEECEIIQCEEIN